MSKLIGIILGVICGSLFVILKFDHYFILRFLEIVFPSVFWIMLLYLTIYREV